MSEYLPSGEIVLGQVRVPSQSLAHPYQECNHERKLENKQQAQNQDFVRGVQNQVFGDGSLQGENPIIEEGCNCTIALP